MVFFCFTQNFFILHASRTFHFFMRPDINEQHQHPIFLIITAVILGVCFFVGMFFWRAKLFAPPHAAAIVTQAKLPISSPRSTLNVDAITSQLQTIVQNQDPSFAFASLQSLVDQNPRLINRCHDLTHAIGDAAFLKYGNFKDAMKFNDYMCGAGYIHALVIGALKNTTDPSPIINSACVGQDGYCYHGIGHGLMFFTDDDVPKALAYCSTFDTAEHAARCSEGVYMQNFEAAADDPTPFVYPEDPLRLCREETKYKPACYHYTGSYLAKIHKSEPNIFTYCDVADADYISKCVSGMGAYLLSAHLNDASIAIHICETTPNAKTTNACIDGLVSYDLVNFNSIPHTEALCASVSKEWQATCTASLDARKNFYK